jgi:predicted nucleic acid-binding protein
MPARVFLDTNILVYAIEVGGPDPARAAVALALARRAVTSRRRASPLRHDEAVAWVQLWKRHDVRPITVPQVDLALEIRHESGLSYFDALVLASARFAGCDVVYSEDMQSGRDYRGVRVVNPFAW